MPKVTIGSTIRTTAARYSERRTHRQLICSGDNLGGRAPLLHSTGGRVSAGGFGGAVGGVRFRGGAGAVEGGLHRLDGVARNRRGVVADRRYDGGQSIVGRRGPKWARVLGPLAAGILVVGVSPVARTVRTPSPPDPVGPGGRLVGAPFAIHWPCASECAVWVPRGLRVPFERRGAPSNMT